MRSTSFLLVFVFLGCSPKIVEGDLKNLNGYWEIEKVTFPNGETKTYSVSTTIDYIELEGGQGFRKKMQPRFNGTFETSNDAEFFEMVQHENDFELRYKNNGNEWQEKLLSISRDEFSVINQDTLTYTYRRFQPIDATK